MRNTCFALSVFAAGCAEESTPSTGAETGSDTVGSGEDEGGSAEATTEVGGEEGGSSESGDGDGDSDSGAEETGVDGSPCIGGPDLGFEGLAQVGAFAGRWEGTNQYGELTTLCDYYGKPLVVDVSYFGCPPCEQNAQFLSTGDPNVITSWASMKSEFIAIRNALQADELAWLTIITMGPGLAPATAADAMTWHDAFPHDAINVVAEPELTFWAHAGGSDYPHHAVISADGRWEAFDSQSPIDLGNGQMGWTSDAAAIMFAAAKYGQ